MFVEASKQTELPRGKQDLSFGFDAMDSKSLMEMVDSEVTHVWMVRTFLKHSDEAVEDEELASVHRDLYDFMLALGPAIESGDATKYLRLARKKLSKLRRATELFEEIQPEVSGHMNFRMASRSLRLAVDRITKLLDVEIPGKGSGTQVVMDDQLSDRN